MYRSPLFAKITDAVLLMCNLHEYKQLNFSIYIHWVMLEHNGSVAVLATFRTKYPILEYYIFSWKRSLTEWENVLTQN